MDVYVCLHLCTCAWMCDPCYYAMQWNLLLYWPGFWFLLIAFNVCRPVLCCIMLLYVTLKWFKCEMLLHEHTHAHTHLPGLIIGVGICKYLLLVCNFMSRKKCLLLWLFKCKQNHQIKPKTKQLQPVTDKRQKHILWQKTTNCNVQPTTTIRKITTTQLLHNCVQFAAT